MCCLSKCEKQKQRHDAHSRDREFDIGESVLARNLREGPKWLPGTIIERTGPVSYRVQVGDQLWRRHTDQLLSSLITPAGSSVEKSQVATDMDSMTSPAPERSVGDLPVSQPVIPQAGTAQSSSDGTVTPSTTVVNMPPGTESGLTSPRKRYPRRQRRPPDRLSQDT